ncbi:NAD(P)/FAD-dependent oxidoreductase [Acholeplasma hippikon]|uniref:Thioredoxin reductase n=1 Tax=Acholeplasma hippikon TaxID=264636 RepID=A0A449BL34_9MOLU|nr:FAD-dependent oxidoreductase [Acholeplasma hippikon]VEU83103.1 thioredoxin reductase [Acholeplasma hippikon]
MYDILIIGSGPAGMTAAIYAKRANLNVVLFEKGAPGGQVVSTAEVENYPGFKKTSGYEVATNMFEHVLSLGIQVKFEEVIEVLDLVTHKVVKTTDSVYETKTVLITTGAVPRTLGVKNEENFTYNGISWCAICDGPLYKDKKIVVVGGGNSAVEESIYLSSLASHVTVVQNLPHLTADLKSQEILRNKENVEIIYDAKVIEFLGDFNLEGVKVLKQDKEILIPCDGVFEYIGLRPVTDMFKNLGILNDYGYVKVNSKMETSVKGIYAAGDVCEKQIRQIVTAVNDGAIAVQNILKYLEQ